MSAKYLELGIQVKQIEDNEILVALLYDFPFQSFEELEHSFHAYGNAEDFDEKTKSEISQILESRSFIFYFKEHENQNWNALWEKNFDSVGIEPGICRIYAPFHEKIPGYKHQIILEPKMAFGTGHHPTTKLMIQAIHEYNFRDKIILDLGTGTGILAIFAHKRGAKEITALDIDPIAIENAVHNAHLNHITDIHWIVGGIDDLSMERDSIDICLANIHLSVLKKHAERIFDLVKPMGLIFLSGVLSRDQKELLSAYQAAGFELDRILEDQGWICAVMRRFTK